ncbi:hypothetical protein [Candidatus Uabimicrobium sp. HlEnr_7]|uniref:hypothetical protein n=1 Tax=Candidatus Uabimicrobium helgolandensis TaxID=3095367 RepID=UPI003557D02C
MLDQIARYRITPQMRHYDKVLYYWQPHVMYFNQINLRTKVCNTDERGFRWTYDKNDNRISYDQFVAHPKPKGIILGNSTAFGVGATHDRYSITSYLNSIGDVTWFNFAGRGYNSTQELFLSQLYLETLKNLDYVVFVGGISNLFGLFLAEEYDPAWGWFYGQYIFQRVFRDKEQGISDKLDVLGLNNSSNTINTKADYQKALNIYRRDLSIWKALQNTYGFKIILALQPFAAWVDKELSQEEKKLFSIYAKVPNYYLGHILGDVKEGYVGGLREICEDLKIEFLDLPEVFTSSEWLFSDPGHLTDKGCLKTAEYLISKI